MDQMGAEATVAVPETSTINDAKKQAKKTKSTER
jgi:hypothetical protein